MANLNASLDTLFTKMESFVSSKTIIGEPMHIGGVTILPLVDVAVGVGAGAGAAEAAGGGLGAKITPSAIIVIENGTVQMINVKSQDSVNKLIDMVPGVVSKFNFGAFKKDDGAASEVTEVKFNEDIDVTPAETAPPAPKTPPEGI